MANKTLLDCVNEVLKRVQVVDSSNTPLLSSLTSSTLQSNIDVAIQVINEGLDELYSRAEVDLPAASAESTITLVTGTREYALSSNLVRMQWPMVDRTNTQYIFQWMDGYENFLLIDPQQLYTGLPTWGIISPITNLLRLDRAPDAPSNGKVYTYEYHKDIALAIATDQVPFNNEVFRSMVPAWVQLYKREKRNEFDQELFKASLGRAARTMTEQPFRTHYNPRG